MNHAKIKFWLLGCECPRGIKPNLSDIHPVEIINVLQYNSINLMHNIYMKTNVRRTIFIQGRKVTMALLKSTSPSASTDPVRDKQYRSKISLRICISANCECIQNYKR